MNNRLVSPTERKSIYSINTSSASKKVVTTSAVTNIFSNIHEELNQNHSPVGMFLDLSKAFDTITTHKKTENCSIHVKAKLLLEIYLTNQTQTVKTSNSVSQPK